ncbi:hypothetical protein Hanom_Chr02g00130411 [Helianthus anomalus]
MNFLMHKLFKFLVMSILVILYILLKSSATLPNTKYIQKTIATSYQLPANNYQSPATFAKHTL